MIALQKEVGQIPGVLKIHLFVPENCRLKITKQYFHPKNIEIWVPPLSNKMVTVFSLFSNSAACYFYSIQGIIRKTILTE